MKAVALLIDDARLERKINQWNLCHAGYEVICSADGEEGLRLAREKKPDVILVDWMLPKLSGADFLRALRSDPEIANIPVIVISSLPLGSAGKLSRRGAARFLEKSQVVGDDGKLLIETIESVLHPVL